MSANDKVLIALKLLQMQAVDDLAEVPAGRLKSVVHELLGKLGECAEVTHVHLYSIRRKPEKFSSASLAAEWSRSGVMLGAAAFNRFPLSFFSSRVVSFLDQGKTTIAYRNETGQACSRIVTAVLRDVGASGYLMCPIILQQRLRGLIAVPVSDTTEPLSSVAYKDVQLFGRILLSGILTNRRDAKRLKEQMQWKRVADAACDFSIALSQTGEISHAQKFGSHKAPDVQGLQFLDFVSRPFRSEVKAILDRSIETHSAATCEFRGAAGRGEECWYHGRIEPQSRDSETVATIYLTNNDVLRQGEEEIRLMQERLERAARLSLLGQLSTEFAHQLNQPLQAIMAYCDTLARRIQSGIRDQDKDLTSLSRIMTSIDHAADIIQRIREFVRYRTLTVECEDLRKIIDRAFLMTSHRAMADGAELIIVPVDPGLLIDDSLDVMVDSVQTTHVLINLIVNAIEAGAGKNSIKIELSILAGSRPDELIVSVRDNGPGLPENTDLVFEKFHSTKSEGFGIGLTISRNVIEAQGGKLAARNLPAGGCEFYFNVQRATSDDSETQELKIPEGPADC